MAGGVKTKGNEMPTQLDEGSFREFLYPGDHPRLTAIRGRGVHDYREYAANVDPFTSELVAGWKPLYGNDFHGVTTDGEIVPDLYTLRDAPPGTAAPTAAMVQAAKVYLASLSDAQRAKAVYEAVDDAHWQLWANPEFMQHDNGLRLEFLEPEQCEAALAVMAASFSPHGFELARNCMRINGILGEIVELSNVMNEFSYNFSIFGTPSEEEPWGWQLFGHHMAVNVVVVGTQMVATPVFFGAEPNYIDEGPFTGAKIFGERIRLGYEAMAAMTVDQRAAAVAYESLVDPTMPEGRVHPGDERHLAGAFQDNRVIPYEGIKVTKLTEKAQEAIRGIIADFVAYLPEGPAEDRRREVEEHWGETRFVWYGGWQPGDVYYYRVQSPVIIAELDHHCGVFLDIDTPKPFHIHTVMRTPNGNDYARALVQQARAAPVD